MTETTPLELFERDLSLTLVQSKEDRFSAMGQINAGGVKVFLGLPSHNKYDCRGVSISDRHPTLSEAQADLFKIYLNPTQEGLKTWMNDQIEKRKAKVDWNAEKEDWYVINPEKGPEGITEAGDEEVEQALEQILERREEECIPLWKRVAKFYALDKLGATEIRKEIPFILYSLDHYDEELQRCDPECAGGSSGPVFGSSMLGFGRGMYGEETIFSEEEISALINNVETIEIGIRKEFDSSYIRTYFTHDVLMADNVWITNSNNHRGQNDIVPYIFEYVLERLSANGMFIARGMLHIGMEGDKEKRYMVIDTHGDAEFIKNHPEIIPRLREMQERYNIDRIGFLEGKYKYKEDQDDEIHSKICFTMADIKQKGMDRINFNVSYIDIEELENGVS